MDTISLPAAEALTSRGHFGWMGGLFNWNDAGLLKGLSSEQAARLLSVMDEVPRLGHDGEAMLAEIAKEHVGLALETISRRFARKNKYGDIRYEGLPHGLHYLKPPLAAPPLR